MDTFSLLSYDGADGGTLLGYPFVTSKAAVVGGQNRVYFSANWQEAWSGLDPSFVTVSVQDAPAAPGQVVVTASVPLDVALRWPPAFACAVA